MRLKKVLLRAGIAICYKSKVLFVLGGKNERYQPSYYLVWKQDEVHTEGQTLSLTKCKKNNLIRQIRGTNLFLYKNCNAWFVFPHRADGWVRRAGRVNVARDVSEHTTQQIYMENIPFPKNLWPQKLFHLNCLKLIKFQKNIYALPPFPIETFPNTPPTKQPSQKSGRKS